MLPCLASGCVRTARLLAPPDHAVRSAPIGELARVEVSRAPGEPLAPFDPPPMARAPGMVHPVEIGRRGTLVVHPLAEGLRWSLWMRSDDMFERHGFRPLVARSGAIPGRIPVEVRFFEPELDASVTVALRELTNPYNPSTLDHGDLLLLQVDGPDGRSERYLLRARDTGVHVGGSAHVLLRVPVSGSQRTLSPILAAGPTLGVRPREPRGLVTGVELVELALSVGIGSTALRDATDQSGVNDQLGGVFDAALVGGGFEFLDVVTVQLFANASALWREASETPWAMGVGLDAVGLARIGRDAAARLGGAHAIDAPE